MNGIAILSTFVDEKGNPSPELQGDDFLWRVIDQRLGGKAVPHVVTGQQAEGFARNGHYDLELIGPNPTSSKALSEKAIAEIRAEHPDFQLPKTASEMAEEMKAENEKLKAELEALKAKAARQSGKGKQEETPAVPHAPTADPAEAKEGGK